MSQNGNSKSWRFGCRLFPHGLSSRIHFSLFLSTTRVAESGPQPLQSGESSVDDHRGAPARFLVPRSRRLPASSHPVPELERRRDGKTPCR